MKLSHQLSEALIMEGVRIDISAWKKTPRAGARGGRTPMSAG